MRDGGIDERRHATSPDFKKTARLADIWIIRLLVVVLALSAPTMILFALLER
jgi:hypothetical protein